MGINNYDKAGLLSALKSKLQDFAGQQSVVLESLSTNVSMRVDALREIQTQHNVLEAKFFEERETLEAKYQKMYQPLYTKRYEIVNGVVEGEKGVPDFWLTAMKNNEELAYEISARDEGALKFLKDIKWSRIDDPKGFKLEFYFDTNPFFKNSVLTKIYHIDEDENDYVPEKAIGTEIRWYPGKCLTQKIVNKKLQNGSQNAKPITKTKKCESFFNFFSPPDVPDEIDDGDDDAAHEFEDLMEQDYDIGSIIREEIIPHAVSWYTGEAAEDEYGDSEDDLDEDETENRKKKGGRGHAREGQQSQDERPPECNQQNDSLFCFALFLFLALMLFLTFF